MKKINKTALTLLFALLLCLFSCAPSGDVWREATYRSDTTLGEGEKTVTVTVVAEEKSVVFTVHTDKETVGEALLEHGLIEGEEGAYGLYVKKVNGILADYDKNQRYWAFYVNGEYAMTGVELTAIEEGVSYSLVYSK